MSEPKQALLLVGSAKTRRSTSEVLGTYMIDKLGAGGYACRTIFTHKLLKSSEKMAEMLSAVAAADLIILTFPLYVDCLPYTVINALEHIAEFRRGRGHAKKQKLMVIINCGFPDSYHNDTAIAICEKFAGEAGFEWAGALSLSGGGVISGRELAKLGGLVRNVSKSLDLAADALIHDESLPQEAFSLMAKRLMPRWLYLFMANREWKQAAKKHGVRDKLKARPYQQPS
jgi:hypothetical protein